MGHKILITGATGNIGQELVKALHNKKEPFMAGVRDVDKAKEKLGNDTELVQFDFEDASTYHASTQGIDKVFLLGPPLVLGLDILLTPFIDHLKLNGILRVVYVSALGIDQIKEMPLHTNVINKLINDGFNLTVLKPSFFAQNFKNYEWDNITQRGITYNVAGEGKVGFIDVVDIGKVAAAILTEDRHTEKEYELTGPELFSFHDAANLLTQLTGRRVVYPNPSAEEYTMALKAAGAPDFLAGYMIPVYSLIKNNQVSFLTGDVEKITGNKPTGLPEVLKRDFGHLN